jgi:hypothetical protein
MTYTFFKINDSEEDDEEQRYSSFVELEDFEEDGPEGFEGLQAGSNLEDFSSGGKKEAQPPTPWDPSESFFAYL